MGGGEFIDRLKSLEIVGTTTQFGASIRPVDARVKTWIVFPDRYRRDLEFSFGRVSTVLGPAGFYLQSGGSILPLPEDERREIAAAVLRHPVILLRERTDSGLVVLDEAGDERDGHDRDTVNVVSGGELSKLEIDPRTGWIVAVRYMTAARPPERQETEIRYSDFRKISGVFFPFAAEGRIGGKPAFSNRIESITVNGRIDPALFLPPAATPAPAPRSPAKRRTPRLNP